MERRTVQTAGDPPPLHAALRVLHLEVWRLRDEAAVNRFRMRAGAVAALADWLGKPEIAEEMRALIEVPWNPEAMDAYGKAAEDAVGRALNALA